MFLHINNTNGISNDVLVLVKDIRNLDIEKIKDKKKIWFRVIVHCGMNHAKEYHLTEEAARSRLAEMLKLCGQPADSAEKIAKDFVIDDRIENEEE